MEYSSVLYMICYIIDVMTQTIKTIEYNSFNFELPNQFITKLKLDGIDSTKLKGNDLKSFNFIMDELRNYLLLNTRKFNMSYNDAKDYLKTWFKEYRDEPAITTSKIIVNVAPWNEKLYNHNKGDIDE